MKRTEIVKINGVEYFVSLMPGDRRTVALRMISASEIEIRFPKYIGRKKALEYLFQKSKWISKKHGLLEAGETAGAGRGLFEGRLLYYHGKKYKVRFGGSRIETRDGNIFLPAGFSEDELDKIYREHTEKAVGKFIEKYRNDIPDCSIKVKKQKTMWGSCNSKRRIYINLRLSMCPPDVIDYVIWHEICHLTHMNHSKDFYNLLSLKCPGYNKQKDWLKRHSMLLKI